MVPLRMENNQTDSRIGFALLYKYRASAFKHEEIAIRIHPQRLSFNIAASTKPHRLALKICNMLLKILSFFAVAAASGFVIHGAVVKVTNSEGLSQDHVSEIYESQIWRTHRLPFQSVPPTPDGPRMTLQ